MSEENEQKAEELETEVDAEKEKEEEEELPIMTVTIKVKSNVCLADLKSRFEDAADEAPEVAELISIEVEAEE